jgi:putative hydrolase of the HAD superfamily
MKPPFAAVVFDMDGTLYDEALIKKALLRKFPRYLPHIQLLRDFSKIRQELAVEQFEGDVRREQTLRLSRKREIGLLEAQSLIEKVMYNLWPAAYKGLAPFPCAAEVLNRLEKEKIPFALLSQYPSWEKLFHLGLSRHNWAAVLSADELGALKPHPKPFLHAARLLGLPPEQILFLGDREDHDVCGAHQAGFLAGRIGLKKNEATAADFRFADLCEFLRFLG